MPLLKIQHGKWFSNEDSTITDGYVFTHGIDDAFTLSAHGSETVGNIYTDVDKLIFRTTNVNEDPTAIGNYLNFHFNDNRSIPFDTPVVLEFDLHVNAENSNKEGLFSCDFLKTTDSTTNCTLKILDLKKDGFHGIYLENDDKTISYPISFKWVHMELTFYKDSQNSTICNVKLDNYILGSIHWLDIQYYDLDMYLCSVNGFIDVSNISIYRIAEHINPVKMKAKIIQIPKENTVILSLTGKDNDVLEEGMYYKLELTRNHANDYWGATLANAVFENMTFAGRRTQSYVSNITTMDIYFLDTIGNPVECTCSYLSSRWQDNNSHDYAPGNFFATNASESWGGGSSSEIMSGTRTDALRFEILFKTKIPLSYINNLTFDNGRGSANTVNVKVYSSDDLINFNQIINKDIPYENNKYTLNVYS